jgi:hypothetical protein
MSGKFYLSNYHPASDDGQVIPSPNASFAEITNACRARAETLVPQWLLSGKRVGDNWIADAPIRPGYVIYVNLKTGAWASRPRRVTP